MTEYITLALAGIAAVLSLICVLIRPKQGATLRDLQNLSQELQEEMRALRTEVGGTIHGTLQSTAELQANAQRQVAEAQNTRLRELSEQLAVRQTALQKAVTDQLQFIEQRMKTGALESEQKLENIRTTMETRIAAMQADNGKRLDEMRHTVDEKLQKTLDEKLQQSFSRVSEQLESVYKGLGEMDPDQLWETTMEPATRTLLQVSIDDAAEAERVVSDLMGDQVEPRKEFIQKHARDVRFLDI